MTERTDYEWRYHTDPVFHARVHVGAQALMQRWQNRSVLNSGPTDAMWAEAKLTAFTILKAVDEAPIADERPPWADGPMPDVSAYVESELFVAGALSTLPPFSTFHPAWALPFARQALIALSEWEPTDA